MPPFDSRKSIAYVEHSSTVAHARTHQVAPGIRTTARPAIECLLRLVDCTGRQSEDPKAAAFEWWAHTAFLSAGHTCVAIDHLLHSAFYLEAAILLRHLTELVAQLRYFENHKDQVQRHMTATSARDRVNFKTMFDESAPGYYERYYSLASGFAHGGLAASLLRVRHHSPTSANVTFGCQFDEDRCTLVANSWVAILHGLLSSFDPSFPNANLGEEGAVAASQALANLDGYLRAHWSEHQKSHGWLRTIGKLVRWAPPTETA